MRSFLVQFKFDMGRSRKRSSPKKKKSIRKDSTMDEMVFTMATVEDEESATERPAKAKKKSKADTALEKFALATVSKKIDGLKAEFASLKTFAPLKTEQSAFAANKTRNRYSNVPCYDATRVVLKYGVPPEVDYIHANYVKTTLCKLDNKYICTQGPMDTTVNDFWRMVWQEKPRSIIMLCKLTEGGKPKCAQYFPLKTGETRQFGKVVVQNFKTTSPASETVFEAVQLNVCVTGEPTIKVTLFKWLDWPDFGVPASGMGMLRILRQVRDFPNTTAIVHCSAGVGRTGTMVACEICLKILLEGKELSPIDVIKEMRGQRAGAVQTEGQYVYLHKTLLEYINAKKIAKDKISEFFNVYKIYQKKAV
uniref:Tyrosine-protein phosphatase non-receptor type 9 n=1 Tax=Parascaris univalens TaxID=6257 RepID=A0A915AN35_PARUN